MNPMDIFKMKGLWDRFTSNHPKFPMFLRAMNANTIREGSIVEMKITTPEGEVIQTNLKITADDMQTYEEFKELAARMRQ